MNSNRPRLMLAATSSGVGKTTLTIGLLGAFLERGMKPAAFKCGPDYIDPLFHAEVLGVRGNNLDLFFAAPEIVGGVFYEGSAEADISVMEGAMGFYDGIGGGDRASGWHVAVETKTPVILVMHPKGAMLSLSAVVAGFTRFRENSMIRGVILNRCSTVYADRLASGIERETGLRVFGNLPELPDVTIESRHLGLATPDAVENVRGRICRLAEQVEENIDVSGLAALARSAPDLTVRTPEIRRVSGAPVRIAVAKDKAFCFYYRENFEVLRALGAELVFFSPLRAARLPDGIGGLYIGGGYPELHAGELAENSLLRDAIREAVEGGMPVVAECGGFLYLQSTLADRDGEEFPMVGVLSGAGRNAGRLKRFGYITLRARRDTLLCAAGEEMPAHEFHYWDSDVVGDAFIAEKASGERSWECVVANETMYAGFPHLYFWSKPDAARRFVEAAIRRREQ